MSAPLRFCTRFFFTNINDMSSLNNIGQASGEATAVESHANSFANWFNPVTWLGILYFILTTLFKVPHFTALLISAVAVLLFTLLVIVVLVFLVLSFFLKNV